MFIPAGESRNVTLPKEVVLTAEYQDQIQDCVYVTSDEDITVQVYNDVHHRSMDGFLALPIETLGKEYIVMTYVPWTQSQVALIALEDNTHITITPTVPLQIATRITPKGLPVTISLDQLKVRQLICRECDFTGTKIMSDKPIAVISGNRCTFIPDVSIDSCDTLVEQLIPVNKWGTTFALTPIPGRSMQIGNHYRVMAARYGTEVSIGPRSVLLKPGQYHEFTIPNNESTLAVANKPVLLSQFITGFDTDNITGDPSMTIIPAVEHRVTSANIATYDMTRDQTWMSNYITISADCNQLSNITFDDQPLIDIHEPNVIDLSGICFVSMNIQSGTHHIRGYSNESTFSAIQYGFAEYNSYAHPVALSLVNTLCVTKSSAGDRIEHNCDEKVLVVELPYTGTYPPPAVNGNCDYSECVSPAVVIAIGAACAALAVSLELIIRYKVNKDRPTGHTLSPGDLKQLKAERRVTRMEQQGKITTTTSPALYDDTVY
ncbi:uncharacterized protein [Amphiura filiformis]|uniref:uncharacterized protein n=1 Tax=Amphiura filiformis TaxID=82378 RepID=UPI003B21481F